jgi:lysyl-tRNA synthetase class I
MPVVRCQIITGKCERKLQVQNNAGFFEALVCDECGYLSQWDVTDTDESRTAFACDCGNTTSYIGENEWRKLDEIEDED